MAKKAAAGSVNKSEAIRVFMAEHPEAKPKEVAEVISKQIGQEVSAQFVSTIKTQAKKKAGAAPAKRGPKPKVAAASSVGSNGMTGAYKTLQAAADLITLAGSVEGAREALGFANALRASKS